MAGLDHFDLAVLGAVALRDWPADKVNRDVTARLKALGLIETVDLKPGKPNYTKGKWAVRATEAGKKLLADRKVQEQTGAESA